MRRQLAGCRRPARRPARRAHPAQVQQTRAIRPAGSSVRRLARGGHRAPPRWFDRVGPCCSSQHDGNSGLLFQVLFVEPGGVDCRRASGDCHRPLPRRALQPSACAVAERRRSRLDPAAEKSCHGRRFAGDSRIAPVLTDGTHISGIPAGSLDAVITFDAFMHLEPWEICGYLEIGQTLLREGGVGIRPLLGCRDTHRFQAVSLTGAGCRRERRRLRHVLRDEQEHHATVGKGRTAPTSVNRPTARKVHRAGESYYASEILSVTASVPV